jgi:hypothetical protein
MNGEKGLAMADKIIGYVYETYDYDKFKLIEGNRELTDARARKIQKNVDKYGQIYNPAIVNEKYEIIDGGGRFSVFKENCMPFQYTMKLGLGLNECQALNQGSKAWGLEDFVHSRIAEGNYNYILLKKLMDKHNEITLRTILYAITGKMTSGANGQIDDKIKSGTFELCDSDYIYADERLCYAEKFIANFPKGKGRREYLFSAVMFAYTIPGFDEDRLLRQYNKYSNSNTFAPYSNVKTAMRSLSNIYNIGAKVKFSIETEWLNRSLFQPNKEETT